MDRSNIFATPHDRFMKSIDKELAKFEQQDASFRKRDRDERAEEIFGPINVAPSVRQTQMPPDSVARRAPSSGGTSRTS